MPSQFDITTVLGLLMGTKQQPLSPKSNRFSRSLVIFTLRISVAFVFFGDFPTLEFLLTNIKVSFSTRGSNSVFLWLLKIWFVWFLNIYL